MTDGSVSPGLEITSAKRSIADGDDRETTDRPDGSAGEQAETTAAEEGGAAGDEATAPASAGSTKADRGATRMPWSVKGVDHETRRLLTMAARKARKPLGRYFNEDIRRMVTEAAKETPLPARQEDLVTVLDKLLAERLAPFQGLPEKVERLAAAQTERGFFRRIFRRASAGRGGHV